MRVPGGEQRQRTVVHVEACQGLIDRFTPNAARGRTPITLRGMGFDVEVGLFLCSDENDEYWPLAQRERFLNEINGALLRHGMAAHQEPRSPAEIDPPLGPGVDPCELGESLGSYSSHSRRCDRLDWLARYVAARGTAPVADPPYEPELYHSYEVLPDRRRAFDHLLAACGEGVVILPRPMETVLCEASSEGPLVLVSADRLRVEAVALGFVLRFPDPAYADTPTADWITSTQVADRSFAELDARISDDADTSRSWIEEATLCHRMLSCANDVLHTKALAITG